MEMEILHIRAFVDQYDGDRFRTVVSNGLHTIHTENILYKNIGDEKFDEVFGLYKQYLKKTSEGVHGKQRNSGLGILKCYTC